jgi:hypothetical protein
MIRNKPMSPKIRIGQIIYLSRFREITAHMADLATVLIQEAMNRGFHGIEIGLRQRCSQRLEVATLRFAHVSEIAVIRGDCTCYAGARHRCRKLSQVYHNLTFRAAEDQAVHRLFPV